MARISPELQHRLMLMIGSIPESVQKQTHDPEEFNDRLVMADGLMRQSEQASTPAERKQLGEQAARILAARPRAQTEQIVVAKMAKSRISDPVRAQALVQQARDELAMHPPAVRRNGVPVAKAKAEGAKPDDDTLMPIYDQAGNLTHVGYPRDLTPVIPQPAAQAKNTTVVKAALRAPVRTAGGRVALLRDLPPRNARRKG